MATYLVQAAYTSEAIKAAIASPQDRAAHIRKVVENLGGKMHGFWFSFGEYDVVALMDMPGNEAAAAIALAIAGGGMVKSLKTTPLLSVQEGLAALQQAAKCGYEPAKTTK
jgi:uncharacterized protein with GYD domain